MIKLIAIMLAIMSMTISGPRRIQRAQGIGTAAVHAPACGIGEAATRVPGDGQGQGIGTAATRAPAK